ncbi:MAG: L-threonylcarbamoyladenylate synthase [Candidatus Nanopelagicales bacterium]
MSAAVVWDCTDPANRDRAIASAVAAMRRGGLVIVPTENCYVVATDAFSVKGTSLLRRAKVQPATTPLGLLVGSPETVSGVAARVPPAAQVLMRTFWPGMVTILLRPQATLAWDHPPQAPVAVRMPVHPIALAVCRRLGPMAASTAGMAGAPAPVTVEEAVDALGDEVAGALDAGRVGETPWSPSEDHQLSSTVVDVRTRIPSIVRPGAVDSARVEGVLGALVGDTVADEPAG